MNDRTEQARSIKAVDFDGTLCVNAFPEIGAPNLKLIRYLIACRNRGDKIILWTCRKDEALKKAVQWCKSHKLYFDAVNENLPEIIEFMGGDTRKIFAQEYIDDRSSNEFDLPFGGETLKEKWAEKEIELTYNQKQYNPGEEIDQKYDMKCAKSALKAYNCLMKDGHSGFSIRLTKGILLRLIDGKPLSPIEDTEDGWSDISDISGLEGEEKNLQCKRMGSLFKYIYADGTFKYRDVNNHYCVNINEPDAIYTSGTVARIIDELFPVKMPYYPTGAIKVYCDDFLCKEENGDFDTVGIFYGVKPDGERIEINRFFAEGENGEMKPITLEEYEQRKAAKIR